MRHPLCALCEGLDHCLIVDCQEVIPDGHAMCWHCEAALAEGFAPESPDDVFYRTPEPWGRPQERGDGHWKHQHEQSRRDHKRSRLG